MNSKGICVQLPSITSNPNEEKKKCCFFLVLHFSLAFQPTNEPGLTWILMCHKRWFHHLLSTLNTYYKCVMCACIYVLSHLVWYTLARRWLPISFSLLLLLFVISSSICEWDNDGGFFCGIITLRDFTLCAVLYVCTSLVSTPTHSLPYCFFTY